MKAGRWGRATALRGGDFKSWVEQRGYNCGWLAKHLGDCFFLHETAISHATRKGIRYKHSLHEQHCMKPQAIACEMLSTAWRKIPSCAALKPSRGMGCSGCSGHGCGCMAVAVAAVAVAVWLCGCWAGATECQMKSEPQFRTCLTQTSAKLGSDFSCWVVDAFCLLLLCFVCFCFLCEQKSILPHVESKIENYFWHW